MSACSRCGKCCKLEICEMGEMAYGITKPPCPALVKRGKIYSCAIIETEKLFFETPILADALGIGKGCEADFEKGKDYGN